MLTRFVRLMAILLFLDNFTRAMNTEYHEQEDSDFIWDSDFLAQNSIHYVDRSFYGDNIDPLVEDEKDRDLWLLFFVKNPSDPDTSPGKKAQNEKIFK